MPAKAQNPASLVKLSPQTPITEKNKPRNKVKEKHTTEALIEEAKTQGHLPERNEELIARRLPPEYGRENRFELVVDAVPYRIHSIPFLWNDKVCFRVHINDNEAHVFAWDEEANHLSAIDDEASVIPGVVEEAIRSKILD